MKHLTDSRKRTFTGILAASLAVATAFGLYQAYRSSSISDERDKFTVRADSLTSVKKNLEADISELSKDLDLERNENDALTTKAEEINKLLAKKEEVLKKLNYQTSNLKKLNKSKDEQMAMLNTQIVELNDMKVLMEKNLEDLQTNNNTLITENAEWKAKYGELKTQSDELNVQIGTLNKKVEDIIYAAPADNFRVEALKPNSKVTAKAKKTNALKISFVVPEMLKTSTTSTQTLYLSILDDKNMPIKGSEKEVSIKANDKLMPITVHSSQTVDFANNPQTATFMFNVKEKLAPGTYKAAVYTDNDYLGTVEFKVRNSFLFF